MALTFTDQVVTGNGVGEGTGKVFRLVTVTFPNPYVAGGIVFTAANVQLSTIDAVFVNQTAPVNADSVIKFDSANTKLTVQVMSTAAEAGAIDLTTYKAQLLVIGNPE